MLNIASIFGFIASFVGLCIQLPQIYKIIKTKSATDLSYISLSLLTTNQIFWFTYAYLVNDIVIILYATGAFTIDITELILKIYYDRRKEKLNKNELEI